jgi:cytoskeletal protein CcmA (bactofilin family)
MFSKPNKPPALHRVSPSIIGANCSLAGDILSDGEVHVDGNVVGDVRCVTLVIGEAGGVTGEIIAETVRVLGSVTGQIAAIAVELARTARIIGDITHDSLSVEAGAHVEGRFNRRPAGGALQTLEAAATDDSSARSSHDAAPPSANVIMLGN